MIKLLKVIFGAILLIFNSPSFSQDMIQFSCNGEGKARGIKFSLNYPSKWIITNGERPHIFKLFDYEDNDGIISMAIYIKLLDDVPSKEQINDAFQKDYLMGFFKNAKIIEFANDAVIEDIRCLILTAYIKQKVYDQEAYAMFKNNQLFFGRYHLQFNFTIISNDQKYETMMKMYNKYNPVFKDIMYSLALNSRWE